MPHPKKCLIALAAAATALGVPATAQAVDVPVSFNYAVLDTPATPNALVVDPSGPPITATASVADDGSFTVDPANFDFPKYEFSTPVPGSIDVILNSPASGQVNFATGQVTLTADFEAQVSVTGLGDCNLDTGALTMSTENQEPYPGVRFPAGPAGLLTGPGAITVSWPSLPPGTGPGCTLINAFVGGPGGFWISKDVPPPQDYAVPALSVTSKPATKTVKSGRTATFKAIVRNRGDVDATNVKVCATAPKPLKPRKACRKIGTLAAGAKVTKSFAFKTPKLKKSKAYKIVFRATAPDAKAGKDSSILTALGKKK